MTNRLSSFKWLWGLFFLRLGRLVLDGAARFLTSGHWTVWVGYGISACTCICLFFLAPVCADYRKAGYYKAGFFGLTLLNTFVLKISAVSVAISVLSILAAYHTYTAHSRICPDGALSKRWQQLFGGELLIAALKMLVSGIGVGLLLLLQINITALTNSLMTLLFAAGAVLSVLYLVLLHKTIRLVGRSDSEIM